MNDTDAQRRSPRLTRLRWGLGWRRLLLLRRAAAGLLAAAALLIAIRGPDPAARLAPVVVAARDLPSGSTTHPGDVQLRHWPVELIPATALGAVDQAAGQVLAGAVTTGEPITAARLVSPELARRALGGREATSVPIRLADAEVAGLLNPGQVVDVVTLGPRADQPAVLASAAVVLTVLPADAKPGGRGRLVLVAVPAAAASRLAAATLSQEVAVILR